MQYLPAYLWQFSINHILHELKIKQSMLFYINEIYSGLSLRCLYWPKTCLGIICCCKFTIYPLFRLSNLFFLNVLMQTETFRHLKKIAHHTPGQRETSSHKVQENSKMGCGSNTKAIHSMEAAPIPSDAHTSIANQQPESDQLRMDHSATISNGNITTVENYFPQMAGKDILSY